MEADWVIENANVVNEGKTYVASVYIKNELILAIEETSSGKYNAKQKINGKDKWLLPGLIDDQVHFREPGLTHKGEIYTEAKAAVAGGITSFMEMPNTVPNTLTQQLLQEKYDLAAQKSIANFSFFMGASNNNLDEVLKTNPKNVCGIKIFMGSSTGNMLVDNNDVLTQIFSQTNMLIATHCEDEETIRNNTAIFKARYGHMVPFSAHPLIRSEDACYKSSSKAVELASKTGARLHVLHISTAKELSLFSNKIPLAEKKITAEACIHHLWFSDDDYLKKGPFIKWNPAVKKASDREAIFEAVKNNTIDVVATDHAPHTKTEKLLDYFRSPSGGPLVQHALVAMLQKVHEQKITIEKVVEKMCHAPAELFKVEKRGYVLPGFKADLVLVNPIKPWTVNQSNILYKCGWSPFEGTTFQSQVEATFVNGHLAYHMGTFDESKKGERLTFNA